MWAIMSLLLAVADTPTIWDHPMRGKVPLMGVLVRVGRTVPWLWNTEGNSNIE